LDGNVTWSGGVLSGSLGIPETHSLIMSANTCQISGGTLTNRGTIIVPAGSAFSCDTGAAIYNYGNFQFDHDAPFLTGSNAVSSFFNYGRLIKTGTDQLNWNTLELHNFGRLELLSGALALSTRAHTLEDNSAVSGPGRLLVSGGSLEVGRNVNCSPLLE